MIIKNVKQLALDIKKDIPKIDGLLIVEKENKSFHIVVSNPNIKLSELAPSIPLLPKDTTEFIANISDGILYIRVLKNGDAFIITSKYPISGIISLFFKSQPEDINIAQEDTRSTPLISLKSAKQNSEKHNNSSHKDIYKVELPGDIKSATSEDQSVYRIQKRHLKNNNLSSYFDKFLLHFDPLNIVGGDFLWIREIEGKIYLLLIDCHIQGASGALLSMYLNNLLEEYNYAKPMIIDDYIFWISKRLSTYHLQNIDDEENQQLEISLGLAIIDLEQLSIELQSNGVGISYLHGSNIAYSTSNSQGKEILKINPQDRLYIMSDGILENSDGGFCMDEINNFLISNSSNKFAKMKPELIFPSPKTDDISVFGIEF